MKIRYRFLVFASGVLAFTMASWGAAIEANPLGNTIREARAALGGVKVQETGLTRADYLPVVEGIVGHFRHFQQADGRIIDPYERRETRSSTACFAWAATVLAVSGHDAELLENAIIALDISLEELAKGTSADRQADFFILPVMLAYEQLRTRVPPDHRAVWEKWLREIEPQQVYQEVLSETRTLVHHSNAAALAGEFLRAESGFGAGTFISRHIPRHIERFTASGLYRSPGEPMAHDHFARLHLAMMIHRGYAGGQSAELTELLERGAWASLLMQSPLGELPSGGHGSQHQWGDAQQCVTFEIWAARKQQAGDTAAARAFKRGAHLALRSVQGWVRPSGDVHIVKNRFDPAARHGYEADSFHSHGNLLAASLLATAWHLADPEIIEGIAPADAGGFVFEVPEFRKIFANAGGFYLQFETGADPLFDSTGLARVHRTGVGGLIGPSAPPAAHEGALSVGLAWREADRWNALAAVTGEMMARVGLTVQRASPQRVQFVIRYELNAPEEQAPVRVITEAYDVAPTQARVIVDVEGEARLFALRFPAMVFDGRRAGRISVERNGALVLLGESRQALLVEQPPAAQWRRTGHWISSRNGYFEMIEVPVSARRIIYRIRPERQRDGLPPGP